MGTGVHKGYDLIGRLAVEPIDQQEVAIDEASAVSRPVAGQRVVLSVWAQWVVVGNE